MSHFTLLVLPDGRALLTTEDDISSDEAVQVRDAFSAWRKSTTGLALIANCSVEKVNSIELDLLDDIIQ